MPPTMILACQVLGLSAFAAAAISCVVMALWLWREWTGPKAEPVDESHPELVVWSTVVAAE